MPGVPSDLTQIVSYGTTLLFWGLASGDLNGDGMLDLVAGDYGLSPEEAVWVATGLHVFYGLTDGGLAKPIAYNGNADGVLIQVADLNGDGLADVVASNLTNVSVFLSSPDGGLLRPSVYEVPTLYGSTIAAIALGDTRGTGRPDLLVANLYHLYLFLNQGDGSYGAPTEIASPVSNVDIPEPIQTILSADFNQDGLADVAILGAVSGYLYVMISDGTGKFETTTYSTDLNPFGDPDTGAIAFSVLPSAGRSNDLVFSGFSEWSDSQCLLHMSNTGDGTFVDGGEYPELGGIHPGGFYPSFIVVGDFNGDCIPDVAMSGIGYGGGCGQAGNIQVLLGNQNGGFGTPQRLVTSGLGPEGVALLGPVAAPRALAVADSCSGGISVLGDASQH